VLPTPTCVRLDIDGSSLAIRISVLVRDTVFHVSLESKQLKMDKMFFQEK
jgi:hypothetical protein